MGDWFCWYKNLGIAVGGDEVVTFILIVSPNREMPDYIKPGF
jgi:hypothetical protein